MNPNLEGWRFLEVERIKNHTALDGLSPEMQPHVLSVFHRIPVVTRNAAFSFGYRRVTDAYWVGNNIEHGWFERAVAGFGGCTLLLTVKRDRSGKRGYEIWRKSKTGC